MSQPNLNEDLNIVANSNLEITLLDGDLNIIQALDDEPNDVGGLTSAQLKAKFDEGPNKIKKYLNETLIPEILAADATEAARTAAENTRISNENQRIANENARVSAESARATAEQARADENTGIVARATQKANEAAESARLASQAMLGQIPDGTFPKTKLVPELQANMDRAGSVSNPNLLDNWYFGNPIDQRQGRVVVPNTTYYSDNTLATAAGTTSAYVTAYRYATGTASGVSYASFKMEDTDTAPTYYAAPENVVRGYTGAGYGIDRWKTTAAEARIIINDGTVTFESDGAWIIIGQLLEHGVSVNMQHTVSALVTAYPSLWRFCVRTFYTDGTFDESVQDLIGVGLNSYTFNPANNTNKTVKTIGCFLQARQNNASITLKAMKLELGTEQTLAHQENGVWVLNEIPDFGEQLARCQRYCIEIVPAVSNDYGAIGSGSAVFTDRVYVCVPLPVTMRAKPTVSYTGNWKLVSGVAAADGFDVNWLDVDHISNNSVTLNVTTANQVLTVGKTYHLWRTPASKNSMLFSADL